MNLSRFTTVAFFSLLSGLSYAQVDSQLNASELLSRVHAKNQMEIKAGELAKEKGTTEKIKRYGDRLIKDHRDAEDRVMELARAENIPVQASPVPKSDQEQEEMQKNQETMAKLEAASGAEFDRLFLENMQKGHKDAIQMLETASVANPDVEELAGKLVPILKQHLTLAYHLDHKEE